MNDVGTKNRNAGIDMLRHYSMVMIIILHLIGIGGIKNSLVTFSANYYVVWSLEIACYCAVNCFSLISGYVSFGKSLKIRNILYLYLQASFYLLIINTLCFIFGITQSFGFRDVLKILFPFAFDQYWYFTAYLFLFFISPLLDAAVSSMKKNQVFAVVFISFILLSVLPLFFNHDIFNTKDGYSVIWLCFMYLVGAFVKKYKIYMKPISGIIIYVCSVLVSLMLKFLLDNISYRFFGGLRGELLFVKYTSPFMFFAAIGLLFFSINDISNRWFHSFFSRIAPLSFGVYLIHASPKLYLYYMNRFSSLSNLSPIFEFFAIIMIALAVWVVCVCIDLLRFKLFKTIKVPEFCLFLENHLIDIWHKLNKRQGGQYKWPKE